MKKICLLFLFLIIFMVLVAHAEKVGELRDLARPQGMVIKGEHLYVIEGATLFCYQLPSLRLIKTFGKEGEGPGEIQKVSLLPNRIVSCSSGLMVEGIVKLLMLSPELELNREVRKRGVAYQLYRLMPFGKGFVGIRMLIENRKIFLSLTLFDGELKVVKDLYRQETVDRDKEIIMLRDTIHYQVHNNRLYVEQSEKGFFIGVYSPAGELVQQIQHNLPGPVLTKRYKKESLENLRTDQLISRLIKSSGGWENFKKKATFTFPENFPAIKDLVVDGDRVYISTFICKQGKEKWVVMDLQGKLPEVAYLPIPTQSSFTVRSMGRENRFFAINKQHFYYLTEDEDNEIWQLHREPIIIVNKK